MNRLAAAFLLLAGSLTPLAMAQEDGASAVVARLQQALLTVMQQADALGFSGRYERLAPVIASTHDLALIARISLGRYWRTLSAQQRERFTDVFSRLSISIYASRFDRYAGERFRIVGSRKTAHGDALVQTRLVKANGEEVHLDYVLRFSHGGWRIVNVVADGVSDLALKRAEYTNVMQNGGLPALIAKLEAKIAQYQ